MATKTWHMPPGHSHPARAHFRRTIRDPITMISDRNFARDVARHQARGGGDAPSHSSEVDTDAVRSTAPGQPSQRGQVAGAHVPRGQGDHQVQRPQAHALRHAGRPPGRRSGRVRGPSRRPLRRLAADVLHPRPARRAPRHRLVAAPPRRHLRVGPPRPRRRRRRPRLRLRSARRRRARRRPLRGRPPRRPHPAPVQRPGDRPPARLLGRAGRLPRGRPVRLEPAVPPAADAAPGPPRRHRPDHHRRGGAHPPRAVRLLAGRASPGVRPLPAGEAWRSRSPALRRLAAQAIDRLRELRREAPDHSGDRRRAAEAASGDVTAERAAAALSYEMARWTARSAGRSYQLIALERSGKPTSPRPDPAKPG